MKKRAFTLIELLVVIAIIAVLMGILMPSLRKVRESARLIKCKANLRSIHVALALYAQENNDKVTDPLGDTASNPSRPNTAVFWKGNYYSRWCRKWYLRFYDYLENKDVYQCPSWKKTEGDSYIAYEVGGQIYYVTYTANEYVLSSRKWEGIGGSGSDRKNYTWTYSELVSKSAHNDPISFFLGDGFYEVNGWGNWRPYQLFAEEGNQAPGVGGRASFRHLGKANFLLADGRIGYLSMDQVESWPGQGEYQEFKPSELK